MTDLQNCVAEMAKAIRTLDIAKEDCKIVIDAAFDLYEEKSGNATKKSLKKFAKAIAERKVTDMTDEIQELTMLLSSVPGWTSEIPNTDSVED